MTEEEALAMLDALEKHYREPVMPVSRYCGAFETWFRVMAEKGEHFAGVRLAITKSNLLARLIYAGEELRTRECPKHKGRWSGILACEHGCDYTGWIRNDWPDGAPRCTKHPDRPAVSGMTSIRTGVAVHTEMCYECYEGKWNPGNRTT